MITPLLRDPGHWRQIQTAGYLQVPVLPPAVVSQLLEEFERFHPVLPASGFVSSTYSADLDYAGRLWRFASGAFGARRGDRRRDDR